MKTCPWCGASTCDPANAFHDLLRRYDLHPWCWSGVGEGWLPLLDRLCADLKALGWHGKIAQIKEKFGGLRFYAEDTDDAMNRRIQTALAESVRTCETCGRPAEVGPIPGTNWYATLCIPHLREATERRGERRGHGAAVAWYEARRLGVLPLEVAIAGLLAELGVDPAEAPGTSPAAEVPALLPPAPPVAVVAEPRPRQGELAWTVLEAWLTTQPAAHAVVISPRAHRMDIAERLVAGRCEVPTEAVRRRELTREQTEAARVRAGGLRHVNVVVADAAGLDWAGGLLAVRGVAAVAPVGLVLVAAADMLARPGVPPDLRPVDALAEGERVAGLLASVVVLAEELGCRALVSASPKSLLLTAARADGMEAGVVAGELIEAGSGMELRWPDLTVRLRGDASGLLREA